MDAILQWLTSHFHSFPLVVFVALLLGGFNVPISEDVLVFMSALLCQSDKANIPIFYAAIFFGATLSDWLVYFWGWLLGRGFISDRFFKKIIKKENTIRFSKALDSIRGYQDVVNKSIADLGSRDARLKLTEERLSGQNDDFTDLMSNNENADLTETIINFNAQNVIYNASLQAGAKVVQNTLLDFLR